MATILIPTDLRRDSFRLIEEAIRSFSGENLDVVLCLGYRLTENRLDLISYNPKRIINMQMSDQSKDRLKQLRQKYADKIRSVQIELFSGANMLAFQNFLETNCIDKALLPPDTFLKYNDEQFFNVSKYIRQSKLDVVEVEKLSVPELTENPIKNLSLLNI